MEQDLPRIQHGGNRRGRVGLPQPQRGAIIGCSRLRHSSLALQDPPRQCAAIRRDSPSPPGLGIDKREDRLSGSFEGAPRTNAVEIVECRVIAGEKKMVAVVDAAAELRVEIRPTTPAPEASGFVELHAVSLLCELHGCSEPRKARANDVYPSVRRRIHALFTPGATEGLSIWQFIGARYEAPARA